MQHLRKLKAIKIPRADHYTIQPLVRENLQQLLTRLQRLASDIIMIGSS